MKQVVENIITRLDTYTKQKQGIHGHITLAQSAQPGIHPIDLDDNGTPIGHASNTAWVYTYIQQEKSLYQKPLELGADAPAEAFKPLQVINETDYKHLPIHERKLFVSFIRGLREEFFSALENEHTQKIFREATNPFLKLSHTNSPKNKEFQNIKTTWEQRVNITNDISTTSPSSRL